MQMLIIHDERFLKRKQFNPDFGKALSPSEADVLRMIAQGHTNKSMAHARSKSIKTIEKFRSSVHRKLGLNCIADLTQYALATGIASNKFGGRHGQ